MPHGSDYVAPPAPRVVTREEFTVPRGRVLCSCGALVRRRVTGTLPVHLRLDTRLSRTCPRSGEAAEDGAKL